jgi:hypothetical protein
MKEMQLHVFLHRLIGPVADSRKLATGSLLCYTAVDVWLNIYGKHRWVDSCRKLIDLRRWVLADWLCAICKLHLRLLFWFFWCLFLALLRVRVIIIIDRTCGKDLLFNLLLRGADFLTLSFICEQRRRLCSLLLEVLGVQLRT